MSRRSPRVKQVLRRDALVQCLLIAILASSSCGKSETRVTSPRAQQPSVEVSAPAEVNPKYPSYVARFDITTQRDLHYSVLLRPLTEGSELAKWPLLKALKADFGDTLATALDAPTIAATISESFPATGKTPLKPLKDLVDDCAKTLCMPPPAVFVQPDPGKIQAYVTGLKEPYILVLSAGLINAFEDSPQELRFVIGHELGHLKCQHTRMGAYSAAILTLLKRVDETALKDLNVLPPLAFGRYLSWCREAEISADRAGLLCCQDPQVAYNALATLGHGLRQQSRYVSGQIDPDELKEETRQWENRPLVESLRVLRKWQGTHPFIEDRMAALKWWWQTGEPATILARRNSAPGNFKARLKVILTEELCDSDESVAPYLIMVRQDNSRIPFPKKEQGRSAAWSADLPVVEGLAGEPLYFEIWASRYGFGYRDKIIGSFIVYMDPMAEKYDVPIRWDVEERTSIARAGRARLRLDFKDVD